MMKACFRTGYAVMFSLLFFCVSCGDMDLFDTDKWSDKIEGWEPNLTAPIAHGSFTMWELLMDTSNSYIGKESVGSGDSILFVQYIKDNIYTLDNISTVFDMPSQDLTIEIPSIAVPNVTVPADGILREQTMTVGTLELPVVDVPAECSLTSIKIDASVGAKWSCGLPYKNFTYEVTFVLENVKTGSGENFKKTITVPVGRDGDVYMNEALFGDITIDMTVPEIQAVVTARIPEQAIVAGTVIGGDLAGAIGLIGIEFSTVEGHIAKAPFDIDIQDLSLDGIDFLNELGGNFMFEEPTLKLIAHIQGIGVPVNLDVTMTAGTKTLELKDGYSLVLKGNGREEEKISSVEFNNVNSSIAAFLSSPVPTGDITCAAKLGIMADPLRLDTITSDGSILLDAQIKIPLKLKADDLTYSDTINDIDLADADKIISGKITIMAENGIPLDLVIPELILLNDQYEAIGSIKNTDATKSTIGAAPATGNSKTRGELVFDLTKDNITALSKSKHIFLKVVAKTNGVVSLKPNAELTFKLIISAKTDLSNLEF